jgi:CBS domain containing-hemolysin-like protein
MKKNKKKKNDNFKWIMTVMIVSFILSIIFSSLSETIIPNINIIFGIILIILFIFIGIIFDMIGVAITAAEEKPFHSMASKRVKGSKHSIKLLKNSDKLASICNDVIGDVCGVVSGGAGMLVASNIAKTFSLNSSLVVLIVTAFIASLTIGGKAIGKSTAIKNSEAITFRVGKILNFFHKNSI